MRTRKLEELQRHSPPTQRQEIVHLVLISGFLGSGKTTLITHLARCCAEKGLRVAILVNEIGEIGIDDQYMRRLGFNVWELLGGCVCCTLAGNLAETLNRLQTEFDSDVVFVEPSGSADPRGVLDAIEGCRDITWKSKQRVVIVDPLRLHMLMEVLTPLITSAIEHADTIIINKIDIAAEDSVANARRIAASINPNGIIMAISAKNNIDPVVVREILLCLN